MTAHTAPTILAILRGRCRCITLAVVAHRLDVTETHLAEILGGRRPITPELARKLGYQLLQGDQHEPRKGTEARSVVARRDQGARTDRATRVTQSG